MNTTIFASATEITATALVELGTIFFLLRDRPKRLRKSYQRICTLLGFTALFCLLYLWGSEAWGLSNYVIFTYILTPLIFLFILAIYDMSLSETAYSALLVILAVIPLRHLMRGLFGILRVHLLITDKLASLPYNLLFTVLEGLALLILYSYARGFIRRHMDTKRSWPQIIWMLFTILPVIFLVNMEQWIALNTESSGLLPHIICEILGICSFIGVLNYDNSIAVAKKEQELAHMETMLMNQRQQYEFKKEAVSSIDRRYHDLKNHLLYLSGAISAEEREAYIAELRTQIESYEAIEQTGNETIDIIITGKKLACAESGISLLTILDGSKLSFIRPIDVATIFGNALDNAITALHNAPADKRSVTVRMSERDTWLILRFENYCAETLTWENGLPVSTKGDDGLHGIGLRSIRYAAEKYGGNVTTEQKDRLFILSVLLPKPQADE